MQDKIMWEYCEKCGKKLMERLPNGLLHFKFGRCDEVEGSKTPVDIKIYGSIKMKCLRRSCEHEQIINYFPPVPPPESE
jgi:phage FluMu protein Com